MTIKIRVELGSLDKLMLKLIRLGIALEYFCLVVETTSEHSDSDLIHRFVRIINRSLQGLLVIQEMVVLKAKRISKF